MGTTPKFKQLELPFLKKHSPWYFEHKAKKRGFRCIAGVDEAGRGPLAGPVVAAAVILPDRISIPGIDDSKKLTPRQRSTLYPIIREEAKSVGVGIATSDEIDKLNILKATFVAMKRAIENLLWVPDYILVDGNHEIPAIFIPQEAIPKGDQLSVSISAASIIAKVERDAIMEKYHQMFPQYNFKSNKGYATLEHRKAIRIHGYCPIHRKTFKGVKEYVG